MTAREWLESCWHMSESTLAYMYLTTGADVYASARDRVLRWSQGARTDAESERVIDKAGEAIVIALACIVPGVDEMAAQVAIERLEQIR